MVESTLIVLLTILAAGLIVPELFRKLRVPLVTSIILVGSFLGPHGLNYVRHDNIIGFFGFLGMTFLMLMAGLETDLSKLKQLRYKVFFMASLNGMVPFVIGLSITRAFGYPWTSSILIGIIFISSSIAIIYPSLKSAGLFKKNVGQIILAAILIADIVSLVFLSLTLQSIAPITKLPLPIYFIVLTLSVFLLFLFLPRITKYIIKEKFPAKAYYEKQLRFVIVIVIAILAFFSVLGVHPILAAFIAGLALSEVARSGRIYEKFYTIGYGIFVPIFFFVVGMEMDLTIFRAFDIKNIIIITIILGLISSKFFSGYVAGRLIKLSKKDSAVFGTASIIQLTTTLAVVYAASSIGLLDSTLVTSIIMLSIITTILGPILLRLMIKTPKKDEV